MCAESLPVTERQDSSILLVEIDRNDVAPVRRITVAGELDVLNVALLDNAVLELLHRRPRRIEIDLRGVTFLDSAGIRALLSCHNEARQRSCRLTLTDPHPMAYRVLEITELLDHFGIAATPAA
jgi:anti-sigma B factor antagonist